MLDFKIYLLEKFSAFNKTGQNNDFRGANNLQNIGNDLWDLVKSQEQTTNLSKIGMKPLRDQLNANERKISKFTGSTSNKSYNTKPKLKTKLARLRLSTISPLLDICTHLIKIEARKNANIDANNNITNSRINRSVTH